MGKTLIISFGHRAQNGKDTAVAAIIRAFPRTDIRRYAFADALKVEVFDALEDPLDPFWDYSGFAMPVDVLPPYAASYTKEGKIEYVNQNKVALRRILQFRGTEYRREQDPLYWVHQLSSQIHADSPSYALISDMRFLNEFYWVKGENGITVNVKRTVEVVRTSPFASAPGQYEPFGAIPTHISETTLDAAPYDHRIGASTVAELESKAVALFESIAGWLKEL